MDPDAVRALKAAFSRYDNDDVFSWRIAIVALSVPPMLAADAVLEAVMATPLMRTLAARRQVKFIEVLRTSFAVPEQQPQRATNGENHGDAVQHVLVKAHLSMTAILSIAVASGELTASDAERALAKCMPLGLSRVYSPSPADYALEFQDFLNERPNDAHAIWLQS